MAAQATLSLEQRIVVPGQRDDLSPAERAALQLIQGQQQRIAHLEQINFHQQQHYHQSAAGYEQRLRGMAVELEQAQQRAAQSEARLAHREKEVEVLQAAHRRDQAQIAHGLREVEALRAQLAIERQHVVRLQALVKAQGAQLADQDTRLSALEARVLERPRETDAVQSTIDFFARHIRAALGGFHPKYYD